MALLSREPQEQDLCLWVGGEKGWKERGGKRMGGWGVGGREA
jgi:hypothetical protein